jgi:hypothetical protein
MANLERKPTADELAGIEWWNSMSEPRRADWLQLADSARPADAWAEFKRRSLENQPEVIRAD